VISRFVPAAMILAASAGPLWAQNDQITFGSPPAWVVASDPMAVPENAEGALFLRKQDTIVHLSERGQEFHLGQMIRILQPQGLQAGNVSLVWNPAAGKPTVHTLRIHREGEVIDVLQKVSFEVLRREDQLEIAKLDGLLTAVLRVPDLRVGDDLEFAFTVPSHDPTFAQTNFGMLLLGTAPPKGRIKLALTWAKGQEPLTRLTPDLQSKAVRQADSIELRYDNPEALSPPKDAPPRYAWVRVIEYSDFMDWRDVSRRSWRLFENASRLSPDSPLRQEAARIAAAHSGRRERAQAALRLVQQQVRYVYVGLNGGNLAPATADETWERRYGDCKGKTTMLLALLSELGIEAEAVFANNFGADDGLDQRLPSPGMFDHVLVRAKIDGTDYWLDGTLPEVIPMRAAPFLPYRWVLPMSGQGTDLVAVPQQKLALPQEMGIFEIDARAGFDRPARQIQTTVKRGVEGLYEYLKFAPLPSDQIKTAVRDALIGGGAWNDVDDVTYRYDRESAASILTIVGSAAPDWDDKGGGAYDLVLPGGGFSPPSRRQRPSGQDQQAPYFANPSYSCHATTVRLPEGTETQNWGFNTVFNTMLFGKVYYRMMEKRDDGTIRMVRGSKVIHPEISAELASKDNQRIADFDNSMARIDFDPKRTFKSWGVLRSVPATYEIDWTKREAPCMPPDVTREQ
jgi:hypothetical protein